MPESCSLPRRRISTKGGPSPRRGSMPSSPKAMKRAGIAACSTPTAPDDRLGTFALTRLLVSKLDIPVIAAGGIMDGAGIAAALTLGAAAAQLGTAFIACPESSADAGYRAALFGPAAEHTVMTSAISGRPARCLANRFTALGASRRTGSDPRLPDRLRRGQGPSCRREGERRVWLRRQWAGQGAPLARAMPAGELMATLRGEIEVSARHNG